MESIQINIIKEDLKTQLTFLIRKEFKLTYYRYRKIPYYLLAWTLIIIAISIFTSTETFVVFKAVSLTITALLWVVGLVFLAAILIKRIKRIKWRDNYIKDFDRNTKSFSIAFDEEKITFITETFKSDINWEYYKYYSEDKNSIYIFPERNVYDAIYFSKNELGANNYEILKNIVKTKLINTNSVNGI